MTGRLEGKAALVTGGTTGLGLAIAERFIDEGSSVVVTGRNSALGDQAGRHLRGRGEARFIRADAAVPEDVRASVAAALDHLDGLDVLVNNAGIGVAATLLDTPVEDFDNVMAVNLRGPFLYAQEVFPHLRERAGCMIHVSSDAGVLGEHRVGAYSVSKAALAMLSNMFALECGPLGVRSNAICPGDIEPGMRHMAPPGEEDGQEDTAGWSLPPVGRIGRASDVAAAAAYLASEEAAFVNGIALVVDGGMRAGYRAGRPPPERTDSESRVDPTEPPLED
jgi:NAD(P)-dependent dehydrogenase (short-subunit alcohol dehydrogenase family)